MRRRQARPRAVRPDDRIAGPDAAPAVIAADVDALTRAGLRQRRPGIARGDRGHENRDHKRRIDGHAALRWLGCRYRQSSPVTGFRLKALNAQARRREEALNYQDYSIGWGNSPDRGPPSLAKVAVPLQDRPSGEMAEWLKAHAWKACVRETVPWVRIPLSPPVWCSPLFAIIRNPQ